VRLDNLELFMVLSGWALANAIGAALVFRERTALIVFALCLSSVIGLIGLGWRWNLTG
jgi:hypothetical protein